MDIRGNFSKYSTENVTPDKEIENVRSRLDQIKINEASFVRESLIEELIDETLEENNYFNNDKICKKDVNPPSIENNNISLDSNLEDILKNIKSTFFQDIISSKNKYWIRNGIDSARSRIFSKKIFSIIVSIVVLSAVLASANSFADPDLNHILVVNETKDFGFISNENTTKVNDSINFNNTVNKSDTDIVSVSLDPENVSDGDSLFVNVTIPASYHISSVKADMGGIESINLSLFNISSEGQLWQAMWAVHDVEAGEYVAVVTATDEENISYHAEARWRVLLLDDAEDNASLEDMTNETEETLQNDTFVEDNSSAPDNETFSPVSPIVLTEKGETWNAYYNSASGETFTHVFSGDINYLNDTGVYNPINTTIQVLPQDHPARQYGYVAYASRGLYAVYFKQNAQDDYPICFAYNRGDSNVTHALRSKLIGVGYYDPSSGHDYTILQTVLNSQGHIEGNKGVYNNILSGVDAEWVYEKYGFKENLIFSNTTKTLLQDSPPSSYGYSNENSYVVTITKLDYKNIYSYEGSTDISSNFTFRNNIKFKDALGKILFSMPAGFVYEQNNESNTNDLIYRLVQYNGEHYLLSGIKATTLNSMEFPVVFDPSTDIDATSDDGYISTTLYSSWAAARNATTGTANSTRSSYEESMFAYYVDAMGSMYVITRSFFEFNTSSISGTVTNATLYIYGFTNDNADVIVVNSSQGTSLDNDDFNNIDFNDECSAEKTGWSILGYNSIPMLAAGLNAINTNGDTTMALIEHDHDYSNVSPISSYIYSGCYYSEESGKEPYLNITYSTSDTTPPTPNPATWSVEPAEDSSSSISMTATTASDSTPPIFCKFWETTGNTGGTTSSWQSADYTYTDTGLDENQIYTYKCQYKDSVATPNIGTNSSTSSDYTDIDPPLSTDFDLGNTITYNSIAMGIDPLPPRSTAGSTGVYFDFVSGGTGAGDQAFSQTYTYTDSGLEENEPYTYRAKFRNGDANDDNEYCTGETVYTYCQKPEDTDVTFGGYGLDWINVSVAQCNNPTSGSTDCYINCTSASPSDADYTDTGWLTDHWYYNFTSLSSNTEYCFKAKFRNYDSVETVLSTTAQCQTTAAQNTSINVTPSQWNQGNVAIGSSNSTTGFHFNLTNQGNVALDIQINASNATNSTTGARWNLTSSAGYNDFCLQYNKSSTWTNINTTYDTFVTSLGVGGYQTFDLKLIMATTSLKGDPLSFTVTFKSVAS